ncbi:MAG: hypothetical protein JWP01_433 [Myxococcales bacterium]|nr:hypothetical protein [Myxococcales bacterium]
MLTAVLMYVERLALVMRLHAAVPELPMPDVIEHASAAVEVATPTVRVELLLAIAYVESRYDVTATSRIEDGKRKTGRHPSTTPPRRLDRKGTLYCGPLQTYARSWDACLQMRDTRVGYAAAVTELQTWLRDPRVRGDIRRALAGHGCGNHGVTTGRCNRYPERVLAIERRLLEPRGPRKATRVPARRTAS